MTKLFQKVPDGPVRNITPNGTVRDQGEQHSYSNGYYPKGTLDTTRIPERTQDGPKPVGNRTGEGCY